MCIIRVPKILHTKGQTKISYRVCAPSRENACIREQSGEARARASSHRRQNPILSVAPAPFVSGHREDPPEKLWVGPDTANFAQGPAKESEVTVMTGDSILLFYDYDRGEFAWDP